MVTLTGSVTQKLINQGAKNERQAPVLVTDKKEYTLRQDGGNAFNDPVLDELVGKKIKCDGRVLGSIFILSDWEELD